MPGVRAAHAVPWIIQSRQLVASCEGLLMPYAPAKPCTLTPGCHGLMRQGTCNRCSKTKPSSTSAQRGYGARWRRFRAAYLARVENCLCLFCKAAGRVTAASEIDHIQPVAGKRSKT